MKPSPSEVSTKVRVNSQSLFRIRAGAPILLPARAAPAAHRSIALAMNSPSCGTNTLNSAGRMASARFSIRRRRRDAERPRRSNSLLSNAGARPIHARQILSNSPPVRSPSAASRRSRGTSFAISASTLFAVPPSLRRGCGPCGCCVASSAIICRICRCSRLGLATRSSAARMASMNCAYSTDSRAAICRSTLST